MGEKTKQVYEALLEGATSGLRDEALYGYVIKRHPKLTDKKLIRSSLKAFKDPALKDRAILSVISTLAINHKLGALTAPTRL